jgi:hypothetical protein
MGVNENRDYREYPGLYYVQKYKNFKILTESPSLLQNHLSFRHLDNKHYQNVL